MATYLRDRSNEAWKWVQGMILVLSASTELNMFNSSPYSQQSHWNINFGLTWSGKPISMRSLNERDGACSLSYSSSSSPIQSPTPTPSSLLTQPAAPIASPACQNNAVAGIPSGWALPKGSNVDSNTLLYRMRQVNALTSVSRYMFS